MEPQRLHFSIQSCRKTSTARCFSRWLPPGSLLFLAGGGKKSAPRCCRLFFFFLSLLVLDFLPVRLQSARPPAAPPEPVTGPLLLLPLITASASFTLCHQQLDYKWRWWTPSRPTLALLLHLLHLLLFPLLLQTAFSSSELHWDSSELDIV